MSRPSSRSRHLGSYPYDTHDDYDREDDNYGLSSRRYRRDSYRIPRRQGNVNRGYQDRWGYYPDEYESGNRNGRGYGDVNNDDNDNDNDNDVNDDDLAGEESRLRRFGDEDADIVAAKHQSSDSTNSAAHLLSGDTLADDTGLQHDDSLKPGSLRVGKRRQQRKQGFLGEYVPALGATQDVTSHLPKGRMASGAYLEEGQGPDTRVRHRGGGGGGGGAAGTAGLWQKEGGSWDGSTMGGSNRGEQRPFWKQKKWWIGMGILLVVLAVIVVPVVVVMTRKHDNSPSHSSDADPDADDDDAPANANLDSISRDSIPESAKGTMLDPFAWYDTTDFNVTYTNETVGDLPIMGLNSTWDDSARANEHVPPLNETFPYGKQPIRGVNLGGWLSLEPFIVPSLFDKYAPTEGIVDEWTLSQRLGDKASSTLEKHYAKFITEQDFVDIRNAGLDHVRIQYSYWAIKLYDNEPYVAQISWRYLLRAIEYCRKYGLRVNLDLHGLVGSQNGWNHSGREGNINWIGGDDGALNRKRSLEFHDQVSKFFAQPRYKNVVTIYGLVNEPLMLSLPVRDVLEWTTEVTKLVQGNGITAWITFHDGFLNLSKWKKMLKGDDVPEKMMLDTHQYTIFNTGQLPLKHKDRVNLICNDWYHMIGEINTTTAGYASFSPPSLKEY